MSDIQPQTKNENTNIYKPVLKVLGLGGGGSNAVTRMIELGMSGVEFIAANTDLQVLKSNPAPRKILMGPHVSRGLGAGGDPRIGRAAAEESSKEIAAALSGADMVFLTAGMGGGTGTGAIPVAAEIARKLGAVTISIVTRPFSFEMGRRQRNATEGIALLQKQSDTLITIPNDRLLFVADRHLPLEMAFRLADDVLRQAVQGISELITEPGMINVDFSHIRRLMKLGGGALMAIGYGQGEDKASRAIDQALHHPMIDSVPLEHAAGVIANFTGGLDLTLFEVEAALTRLQELTSSQTEIVLGIINDERLEGRVQVTLIVTGLGAPTLEEALSKVARAQPAEVKTEPPQSAPAPHASVPGTPVIEFTPSEPSISIPVTPLKVSPSNTDIDLPAFLRRRVRYAG